jgi:putative peptidoglycan lipid II flippase
MTPARFLENQPALEAARVLKAIPAGRRSSGFLLDTLTLSAIAGFAKIAGASKSIVIARVFGSGPALDSYLLAFLIPSVLADTFCGALVPVMVPRLIELEHGSGVAAAHALYARLLHRSLRFSLLGMGWIALGIGGLLEFSGGTTAANWRQAGLLASLMLPVIPCNAIANVWRAVLNSQNKFAAPGITVMLTPLTIAIAVLTVGHRGGVWVLAAATTLGAAGELALLAMAMRGSRLPIVPRRSGAEVSRELALAGFRMRPFRKEYGYLVASGAVSGGTVVIGQAMAAWLGPGSVSTLNYGTRLSTVLMSIGPAAFGVAVLPRLSQLVAERGWEGLKHSLRRLLWGSAAASAAAAVLFIVFSAPIVRLTLQHGAFTAANTGAVARVQAWSLLQMPFVAGISIFMRVFSVLKANRVLLPLSGAALVVNLTLNYVFMHRYGVAGIALAASMAQALLFMAMAWLMFGPSGLRLVKEVH